ncbi:MAG: PPC domain-containing protein, partial [Roseimicrobium sp.]
MNFSIRLHRFVLRAACVAGFAGMAHGAYPEFTTTKPNGGQRGADVKVTLSGNRLADFDGIVFMSPGFTLKSTDKVENNKVDVTLSIAPEVPPGLHMFRIRTKSGISHFRPFYVGQFPNAEEKEPNNDFETPQSAQLNQTIEGVVTNEDVDYYKMNAKKGQRISVEVEALRLGYTVFDPYIAILDKDRFELATADDTILFRQDGYLNFTVPEDGDYTVQVRESSYRGGGNNFYRLHIGTFRRPEMVYPAGGKVGTVTKVRFIERDGQSFEEDVQLPAEPDQRLLLLSKSQEPAPNGNPFRAMPFDNALEAEPNDEQAKATSAPTGEPIALNGIIEKKGDIDYFKVPLKKGMKLDVMGFAQTLGSPLDPVVNVYNDKGGSLGGNDDGGGRRRLDSKVTIN